MQCSPSDVGRAPPSFACQLVASQPSARPPLPAPPPRPRRRCKSHSASGRGPLSPPTPAANGGHRVPTGPERWPRHPNAGVSCFPLHIPWFCGLTRNTNPGWKSAGLIVFMLTEGGSGWPKAARFQERADIQVSYLPSSINFKQNHPPFYRCFFLQCFFQLHQINSFPRQAVSEIFNGLPLLIKSFYCAAINHHRP